MADSKMNVNLNLLDLPVENLEFIFSYCIGSLLKLTETNKYIKNVVESSGLLMKHICLIMETRQSIEYEKISEIWPNLTRNYRSIKLILSLAGRVSLQEFFDKNAESLKKVEIEMHFNEEEVFRVLRQLENLLNLEDLTLNIYGSYDDDDEVLTNDLSVAPFKFKKLKHLSLRTNLAAVFELFKECSTIETLYLRLVRFNMSLTSFYKILINSRETLKSLNTFFPNNFLDIFRSEAKSNTKFAEFLVALKNSNLNLNRLTLSFVELLYHENVARLREFLMSQKSLKNFTYEGKIDQFFLDHIKIVADKELKMFEITCWGSHEDNNEIMYQPWKIENLEILKILSPANLYAPDVVHSLLHVSSDLLKEVSLSHINLGSNALTNITRNYRNLTQLNVDDCHNHESNDIFLILNHLKKLKFLSFNFPEKSVLDIDLFVNNEDLILPEIYEVHFKFNSSMDNFHVTNLMQPIKNVSIFSFDYDGWRSFNNFTLFIIVRELPNLKNLLNVGKFDLIGPSTLKKIKNHVHLFNNNPELFKFCDKEIDVLMEESIRRQQLLQ